MSPVTSPDSPGARNQHMAVGRWQWSHRIEPSPPVLPQALVRRRMRAQISDGSQRPWTSPRAQSIRLPVCHRRYRALHLPTVLSVLCRRTDSGPAACPGCGESEPCDREQPMPGMPDDEKEPDHPMVLRRCGRIRRDYDYVRNPVAGASGASSPAETCRLRREQPCSSGRQHLIAYRPRRCWATSRAVPTGASGLWLDRRRGLPRHT